MVPLFVTLKKVYVRKVVNKYGLYLLLGAMIYNLIDYIYIYMYTHIYIWIFTSIVTVFVGVCRDYLCVKSCAIFFLALCLGEKLLHFCFFICFFPMPWIAI